MLTADEVNELAEHAGFFFIDRREKENKNQFDKRRKDNKTLSQKRK
jgi:hypothetical protein